METLLWTLLGVIAGACIATQAPINVQLGKSLGMPFAAAAMSFLAGAIALWVISFAMAHFQGISINFTAPAPWLFVTGGLLGAVFVTSTIVLTPMIGTAAVMGLAITGQLLAGLTLDRVGFLGTAVREISVGRIAGAVLLVIGAVMIRVL